VKRESTTREDVEAWLNNHKQSGFHVDSRLLLEITQPGQLSLLTLETEDEFLSLVWQAVDETRPLTPKAQPRSLKDCASRLAFFGWSFEALVHGGFPWFQKCTDIDVAFDFGKVGWIAVTPLVVGELKETPHGNYYIYDGVHKSIVLAKRILRRELQYCAIDVLLLEPRRH
jgi:hypothetical protein